ncbi:MAG: hypothetical protein ACRENV_04390, partial [Candidatus Dormibacteria bacterium]
MEGHIGHLFAYPRMQGSISGQRSCSCFKRSPEMDANHLAPTRAGWTLRPRLQCQPGDGWSAGIVHN